MNFGCMVNETEWPKYDEEKTKENSVEIVIQILGKVRAKMTVAVDMPKDEVIALAKAEPKIAELLDGKEIKKEIFVPGKLVNFVAM